MGSFLFLLLCETAILFQIRQLIDQNIYWFAIPNIGSVLKGLSQVSELLVMFFLDNSESNI